MKQSFDEELDPVIREKMKKNLVYIGMFSVVMLFAGFTSAYIVSMGDSFWVKYDFPPAFYVSTILIILSSLVLEFGIRKGKAGNSKLAQIGVLLTLILGIGFAYFQFKGYSQLVDNGAVAVNKITVANGRYGTYYEMKVNGKYLEVNGNDYLINGKVISETQKNEISSFAKQLETIGDMKPHAVNNYGKFTLTYKSQEVKMKENKFFVQDTVQLKFVDLKRMEEFSWHLRDGRGDFYHKGKYGKDFVIYFKGKKLDFKERSLYYKGRKLDPPLQLKMDDSADAATSYLYIITFLHLLHILVTLIYMFRMSIRSFTGRLQYNNYLSVRLGAIFWHFLGALWIYLLLFLLFIH